MGETGVGTSSSVCRRTAATAIVIGIAAIHAFRAGSYLGGKEYRLYYSYASDILLPLAVYFLLCLSERQAGTLGDWRIKAAVVFAAASSAELLQGLGVPMLGRTFDPLDFVMYGVGVLGAVLVDRVGLSVLCRARSVPRNRAMAEGKAASKLIKPCQRR